MKNCIRDRTQNSLQILSEFKRILEKIPKVEFYPNFLSRNFLKMVDPPAAFKFKVSDKNTWLIPPENVGKPEVV